MLARNYNSYSSKDRFDVIYEECNAQELSTWEITGTGSIDIKNTGGSSASEGGMGTGGGAEKGAGITEQNGKKDKQDKSNTDSSEQDTWDPLKPKEEKDKGKS